VNDIRNFKLTETIKPFSAEVKNEWTYDSIPSSCLHGEYREKSSFFSFKLNMII